MREKNILFIYTSIEEGGVPIIMLNIADILSEQGYNIFIASKYGNLISRIKQKGFKFYRLSNNFQTSNLFFQIIIYFITILRINSFIRLNNIDTIFNNSRYTSVLSFIISKFNNISFISCAHGNYLGKRFVGNKLWGEKIIAVSEGVQNHLINKFHIDNKKIFVIRNSIPQLTKYSNKVLLQFKNSFKFNNSIIISCIARFDETKGHIYLLKACKELLKLENDVKLLLIGYGTLEDSLRNYVNYNNLNNSVFFLPRNSDIAKIIGISEFVILPSLREGLPTVVLESFSLGIPVIATNVPGTDEIVIDNFNGLMVQPGNVEDLEKSILKLCRDDLLRKSLGHNALITYKEKFSFENYKKEIIKFFK